MIDAERRDVLPPARTSRRLVASLSRIKAPAAALIFVAALLTRVLWSNVPINVDEDHWIERGAAFVGALLHGDLAGTYLRHHPGVTNMWVVGAALSLRYLVRGLLPLDDLARQSADLAAYLAAVPAAAGAPAALYVWTRSLSAVVTAASLVGIYALARRLWGTPVALIAAAILLFEPFFLAYQRSLTTDAYQTNFTWLALLAFLLWLKERSRGSSGRRWLLISAACYGLAVLSKTSALLSLPVIFLWALAWTAFRRSREAWRVTAVDLVLWGATAAAVAFLLWPALWHGPVAVLERLRVDLGNEVAGHTQFFFGQKTRDPGPAYYPVVLLFRLSPLLLVGSLLGLLGLSVPALRRHMPGSWLMAAVCLNLAVVLAGLTVNASKIDRYMIPLIPGLAFLAAAGLWAVLSFVVEWRNSRDPARVGACATSWRSRMPLRLAAALAGVLILQLGTLIPDYPYCLTYFNPLLGGTRRAVQVLMVGNGELLDQAAAWLNARSDAGAAAVASYYPAAFAPFYRGEVVDERTLARARYVVLYVNQFQRNLEPAPYFAAQHPVYAAQAHGVDYVRVYRGPVADPEDFAAVTDRLDLDFGGRVQLLAYELETPQVAAGETAVVVLYWQAKHSLVPAGYTVNLGLRDEEGNYYGSADSAPFGGYLAGSEWTPGQLVRDVAELRAPPGTPPGHYTIEIGLTSAEQGGGLGIRDESRAYGTRYALTTVEVVRPEEPIHLTLFR